MTDEEIKEILDELNTVRPEKLNTEAKRLFDAIMKIADDKDKAEADLYEAKNRISDLLDTIKEKDKKIEELKEKHKKLTDEYLIQRDLINSDFLKDYISKEEAKQKEKKAYIDGTNVAHELCNKYWEDKIKAKIEELKEDEKREIIVLNPDTKGGCIKNVSYEKEIKVLQSLLKE